MEHYGLLTLLPPVLTVILAILTKDVIISLFAGIFSGTLIIAGGNPFIALVSLTDVIAKVLTDDWNIRIILFCGLLGALIGILSKTGAAYSFGNWASSKIKSRTGILIFTWVFGLIIFIDDYFNSLTIGTCMRPITDKKGISRAKLAYILDSTAAPVCIIAPISSWVVTVMSIIKGSQGFEKMGMSEFSYFIKLIPYNFYALFAIIMVVVIALTHRDFGPMALSEKRAETKGELYNQIQFGEPTGEIEVNSTNTKSKPFDFIFPLFILIVLAVCFFPITTYLGSINGNEITTFKQAFQSMTIMDAFKDTDASKALMYSIIFTIVITYIYFISRRLMNIKSSAEAIVNGLKSMVPALIILTLAWSIGQIIKNVPADGGLGLANFLSQAVVNGGFPLWALPAVAYIISCFIAFSMGTSWGTFTIMVPIIMPISIALAESLGMQGTEMINATMISIGAVLGGAIFGDHCSPISDTTILSSTGAGCPHLEHVNTQLPYAVFTALCCLLGTLLTGITGSISAGLAITALFFAIGIILLPKFWGESYFQKKL